MSGTSSISPAAGSLPDTVTGPLALPALSAIAVGTAEVAFVSAEGEIEELPLAQARRRLADGPVLLCHGTFTLRRLGIDDPAASAAHFDLLDLFAFARPAGFAVPSPSGLAQALNLPPATGLVDQALSLHKIAALLIQELRDLPAAARDRAAGLAAVLAKARWCWAPAILQATGYPADEVTRAALEPWNVLPDWEDPPPRGEPTDYLVSKEEAAARLAALLGPDAETRAGQRRFSKEIIPVFAPRVMPGTPNLVLGEAGTGIGKTLGYLAPAVTWAEKNDGTVWVSTYTKNLQRQLDQELRRAFADPESHRSKVVIRKGRENYLCLLNLQEALSRLQTASGPGLIVLGLIARWAEHTRDGDMVGGDFPGWLATSSARLRGLPSLTDRRGECIYSACPHYRKCFVENAARRSHWADIVIANHALVMHRMAVDRALDSHAGASNTHRAGDAQGDTPSAERHFTRLIFDEGHHVFDAADSAFSAHLTIQEASELRRWIRGAESAGRSRRRGLLERAQELVNTAEGEQALNDAIRHAADLPAGGWTGRLAQSNAIGPAEEFFARAREHVLARTADGDSPYSLEAASNDPDAQLIDVALGFADALGNLARPLNALSRHLKQRLDDEASDLTSQERARIESVARSIDRRAILLLPAWRDMLNQIGGETPEDFVDWFSLDRIGGREIDIGLHRHWVDPTIPFAATVLEPAQGVLITSATLRDHAPALPESLTETIDRDGESRDDADWQNAEMRNGAAHLAIPPKRFSIRSPFDYETQARVLIVNDIDRDDPDQVASAYRELFLAAGGGALGLFTAIARLRAVWERLRLPMDEAGIALLAQHIDAIDTGTLIDIFRHETQACLLGTDAVRDGVDVPGDSLRLVVFDRVPWPRPTLLHKARRARFGKTRYDDMVTRLRLKQAFGRLIRRQSDHGVFVMLDARTPSRLLTAFPDDVHVERVGLASAIGATRDFLR